MRRKQDVALKEVVSEANSIFATRAVPGCRRQFGEGKGFCNSQTQKWCRKPSSCRCSSAPDGATAYAVRCVPCSCLQSPMLWTACACSPWSPGLHIHAVHVHMVCEYLQSMCTWTANLDSP